VQTIRAHVTRIRHLTADVREIRFGLDEPAIFRFAAGQFVSFTIDRPGEDRRVTRAYSIASSPSRTSEIEIVLNLVPGGPGSTYLFSLREGDAVTFRGPAGSFTLHESARELLFVATGTGIAPFRSMLWWLAEHGSERTIRLFWGLRRREDLYYQDELHDLRAGLRAFTPLTTLSQPDGVWTGAVGRVTPHIAHGVTHVDNLDVYLCGNAGMIADVRQIIRARGLCPIHTEQYYAEPRRD
jgi:NAD(P)H-flavin reductase